MENTELYIRFEANLTQSLLKYCKDMSMLGSQLLEVEELEEAWETMSAEYMADAVPNVVEYPLVALAWAGYLGIGSAHLWDEDWAKHSNATKLYTKMQSPRGFDEMDEYIIQGMLKIVLDSTEAKKIEDTLRGCADIARTLIRKEGFLPQTKEAFFVFSHACKIIFKIGVSMELYRLGYKYEKVVVDVPQTLS